MSTTEVKKIKKGNNLTALMKKTAKGNFDQIFDLDEKEMDKQTKYHMSRKGKQVQLLAKVNQIQQQIAKTEVEFTKSLVDPTKDSVDLAITLKALAEEQKIAEEILLQLFPESKIG